MKKLNRKGFTLVELLAVIIILAIVVGITIPAVLTTTSKAKTKAFETAAQTAADWVDRQYQVLSTGLDDTGIAKLDSNFNAVYGVKTTGDKQVPCMEETQNGATIISEGTTDGCSKIVNSSFITAAGLTTANVEKINVKINTNTGRSCVTLTATTTGDYNKAGANGAMTMQKGSC